MFDPNQLTAQWLLLQVKPRQEQRALANLECQGGQCYCPQVLSEKLVRGKRVQVQEALFPGYVFFYSNPTQDGLTYTTIHSSRGVSKIVRFGAHYAAIPQALVDHIKQREAQKQEATTHSSLPQKGDKVAILEGPFRGLQAIYQQAQGDKRSLLLIDLLNQQSKISLENNILKKQA